MDHETPFLDASGNRLPGEIRGGAGTLTIEAGEGGRKRFRMLAYSGGPLALKDYAHPVVVDLAGVTIEAQSMMMLAEHDENRPVGESESITVTAGGIEIAGYIDATTDDGRLIHAAGKGGFAWEGSIGAPVQAMEEYAKGEKVTVNGRQFSGPLYVARKTTLRETSFVKRGADTGRTHVAIAATHKGDSKMEPKFEAYIKASGFDPLTLTEPQTVSLKAAFDAAEKKAVKDAAKAAAAANPPIAAAGAANDEVQKILAEFRKETVAENTRVAAINAKCKEHPDIAAKAIGEGWTADKAELEVLRAGRPDGFNIIVPSGGNRESELQALQGAMIIRAGGRLDNPAYQSSQAFALPGLPSWIRAGINTEQRQRLMELSHKFAHLSAIDICRRAVALDGRSVPIERGEMIRAAFSGGSLTNIFTTNVNASLISSYMEYPNTVPGWTQASDVNDFKENSEIRLLKDGTAMKILPRGTEAQHGSRSDVVEVFKAQRFAEQFVLDEQDIIDDNLGAFSEIPTEMGYKAARLAPDLAYAVLLANPTLSATGLALFADANTPDNLRASSALTAANLKAAISQMMLATENGVNLNIMPTHLIVPPSLMFTARELINSSLIVSGNTAERGNANVLQGALIIVSDPRLENGVTSPITGVTSSGSATTWYLASSNARTIKLVYLSGSGRAPQVRNWTLSEGKWGMGWDVKMDIGVAAMDHIGLQKNTA